MDLLSLHYKRPAISPGRESSIETLVGHRDVVFEFAAEREATTAGHDGQAGLL